MRLSKKHNNVMGLTLCVGLFLLFTWGSAGAGNTPDVSYKNGLLSLKANTTPLLDILKQISAITGVDIMVSTDFRPADITIQFTDETLESAFKRLLESYSHVAIYEKKGSVVEVSQIRVYPKGTGSGPLLALIGRPPADKNQAIVTSKNDVDRFKPLSAPEMSQGLERASGQAELLAVKPYTGNATSELTASFGKRFEIQEEEAFAKIEELKKRMDLTQNAAEKEALNTVLMDKLAAFEELQRTNQNRLEAMHRIELFEKSKNNSEQAKQ